MACTLTYTYIRRLYEECTWKNGDLDGLLQTVVGVEGRKHFFHERRLLSKRKALETILIKHMPDRLMRTKSSGMLPWYALRLDKEAMPFGSLHVVEQLVALIVGAGLATLTPRKIDGVEETVDYIVIEDGRIRGRRRRERSEYALKYYYKKKKT